MASHVYTNFDEIEDEVKRFAPPVVYKYRSWKSDEHKNLLINKTVWFAHPFTLNDKQDLRHPYKINTGGYNLPQFYEKLKKLLKKREPHLSDRELRFYTDKKWIEIQNDPIKYFKTNLEALHNDYEFYKRIGVFSTSMNGLIDKVWHGYGNNHEGYCLGFKMIEFARLMYCKFCPVTYSNEAMEINLIDGFTEELHIREESLKTTKWGYEEEYRFLTLNIQHENRIKYFTTESVQEIILGYNISLKNENEIIKIVRQNYNDFIPIYKTIPSSGKPYLEKQLLNK